MLIILHGENLLSLEVGGSGLGLVNLRHREGQHVLGDQQEVGPPRSKSGRLRLSMHTFFSYLF